MPAFQNVGSTAGYSIQSGLADLGTRLKEQADAKKRTLQNAKLAEQFFKINPEALPAAGFSSFEDFSGQSAPDKIASFAAFQMKQSAQAQPPSFFSPPGSDETYVTHGNTILRVPKANELSRLDEARIGEIEATTKLREAQAANVGQGGSKETAFLRGMGVEDEKQRKDALLKQLDDLEEDAVYLRGKLQKNNRYPGWDAYNEFMGPLSPFKERGQKLEQIERRIGMIKDELGIKESKQSETSTSSGRGAEQSSPFIATDEPAAKAGGNRMNTRIKWNPETGEFE